MANPKLFLNAEQGSLAFQKEQDFPDWDNGILDATAEANWNADPGVDFTTQVAAGRILDVRNARRCVFALSVSGGDTYDFTIKNGMNGPVPNWYDLDGGVYTGESGNLFIGVDCLGLEYVCVVVDAVSGANNLRIDGAILPYEVAE